MYKTILVPLDGSKRAEAILPHVEEMAHRFAANVVFMQVVESHIIATSAYDAVVLDAAAFEQGTKQAKAYLTSLRGEVHEKGIEAKWFVEHGPVVETIIDVAAREGADLIAMASHGPGRVIPRVLRQRRRRRFATSGQAIAAHPRAGTCVKMNDLAAENLMDWAQKEHMPTYRFKCDVCGAVFEKRLHMTDDKSRVVCPYGHTKVHQIHTVPQIIFKGSGFYVTDNRSESATHAVDGNRQNRRVGNGNGN